MERKKLTAYFREAEGVHKKWGWFFALGILLVLVGLAVIGSAYQATLFSVFVFGALLLGTGVVQLVQAIFAKKWSGFFPSLILSLLYIVTGVLCLANPAQAARRRNGCLPGSDERVGHLRPNRR